MNNLTMKEYAQQFTDLKHAAGVDFIHGMYWINRYLNYHETKHSESPFFTKDSVNGFVDSLKVKDKSGLTYIREFGVYLRLMGVDAFVYKTPIPQNIPELPYIITESEGDKFFEVAHGYCYQHDELSQI